MKQRPIDGLDVIEYLADKKDKLPQGAFEVIMRVILNIEKRRSRKNSGRQ